MDEEIEQAIVEYYPDVFALHSRHVDLAEYDEDDLVAPISTFGFQCGDGWASIIAGLASVLENIADRQDDGTDIVFHQVKEKFGGLRAYTSNAPPRAMGAVRMAEEMSRRTCEECGQTGPGDEFMRDDGGWLRVRCDECYEN